MAVNVLVVDDSSVMRTMIIRTLRVLGVPLGRVYQAGNGEEGLRIIQDNPVDLALVDINMPVMNGEEMLDRLKDDERARKVKVVVVSSEGSFIRIRELRRKGAEFVRKPFTPKGLQGAITASMGDGDG